MSKRGKVVIGVIVVAIVVVGLGLLRWGEMVYRASDGERGWSMGATVYQALGWGSEAYRADLDRAAPEEGAFGRGRIAHSGWGFGPFRAVRGLGGLVFLAALIGLGVFLWRRQRKTQTEQT